MIQAVYGIKDFQVKLPKIARQIASEGGHYLVTNRNKPSLVAIPFGDYQEIEDILLELNAPLLKKELKIGRMEYRKGNTSDFRELITSLND